MTFSKCSNLKYLFPSTLPAQPGPPEVTVTTTDSSIKLIWNTILHCFESEMFTFVVIWNEIGSGTSTNVTTSSSPYTISGLQPGTSYQISVQGVGGSGVVGGIRVLSVRTSGNRPVGSIFEVQRPLKKIFTHFSHALCTVCSILMITALLQNTLI